MSTTQATFLGGDPSIRMPGRSDLMSLSTINQKNDQVKTTTSRFTTMRGASNNLTTNDIAGKFLFAIHSHVTVRCLTKTSWIKGNQQARVS